MDQICPTFTVSKFKIEYHLSGRYNEGSGEAAAIGLGLLYNYPNIVNPTENCRLHIKKKEFYMCMT